MPGAHQISPSSSSTWPLSCAAAIGAAVALTAAAASGGCGGKKKPDDGSAAVAPSSAAASSATRPAPFQRAQDVVDTKRTAVLACLSKERDDDPAIAEAHVRGSASASRRIVIAGVSLGRIVGGGTSYDGASTAAIACIEGAVAGLTVPPLPPDWGDNNDAFSLRFDLNREAPRHTLTDDAVALVWDRAKARIADTCCDDTAREGARRWQERAIRPTFKLSVDIRPDGSVSAVRFLEPGYLQLGPCLEREVGVLRFSTSPGGRAAVELMGEVPHVDPTGGKPVMSASSFHDAVIAALRANDPAASARQDGQDWLFRCGASGEQRVRFSDQPKTNASAERLASIGALSCHSLTAREDE